MANIKEKFEDTKMKARKVWEENKGRVKAFGAIFGTTLAIFGLGYLRGRQVSGEMVKSAVEEALDHHAVDVYLYDETEELEGDHKPEE